MASRKRLDMVNGGKPVGHRWAKIPEAAEYLRCAPVTIREMISDGRLRAYRSGSRLIRVDLAELDALMAGDTGGAA
ncbi:MAG TPA: helix-turn-helix domain-containing protein [Mycobacterium sp.]|nr:helix-turn-helix domain-containing protein [Mycobacterium sp.]